MASIDKMLPSFDDVTFWLLVNVILFLYVGIEELVHGYGPGSLLSAGAVVIAVIYLMLFLWGRTDRRMANRWTMIISGLAFLGDLIFIANNWLGAFTGSSALLDIAGLMLFYASYKALKGPA